MVESEVEKAIRLYAESKGCLFWKFTSPGTKGVMDRLVIAPGNRSALLEVKRPGKKPYPIQLKRKREVEERGMMVDWVDNIEAGKKFIDDLLCS